ncbi:MAG: hypothetical protein DHS20C02_04540 [Micavibrio sp.]|nr:MAG: hypothetical protein DHS20C02_04540 [Micavibrio sp.]
MSKCIKLLFCAEVKKDRLEHGPSFCPPSSYAVVSGNSEPIEYTDHILLDENNKPQATVTPIIERTGITLCIDKNTASGEVAWEGLRQDIIVPWLCLN